MSNVSFTIHTPLQRTLHPTGPTIPDTYCISTLTAISIQPFLKILSKNSLPNSSGLILAPPSTSVVSFLFPLALHTTSPYQYHCLNQWSHSLAVPTLYHQNTVLAMSPTGPITTISLALPCLLTGCVQSFVIDLPTCSNWTNYLHPSHWPNPPPPSGHTTDDSLVVENIVWTLFAVGLKSTTDRNGSRKP